MTGHQRSNIEDQGSINCTCSYVGPTINQLRVSKVAPNYDTNTHTFISLAQLSAASEARGASWCNCEASWCNCGASWCKCEASWCSC